MGAYMPAHLPPNQDKDLYLVYERVQRNIIVSYFLESYSFLSKIGTALFKNVTTMESYYQIILFYV